MGESAQRLTKRVPKAERRRNVDRSAATRLQILDATIRALTEFGYGAVTNHLVAELAGVSRGAMVHHFPTRQDLLVATVEHAYNKLSEYRAEQLEKLKPGLPRFRALIHLAFDTATRPPGFAVNEIRSGSRSDPDIAEAVTPMMTHIANDYARFIGRHVRAAGMVPDNEIRGLAAVATMAARSMSINDFTHRGEQISDNILLTLTHTRERIIARQLGENAAWCGEEIDRQLKLARPKRGSRKQAR